MDTAANTTERLGTYLEAHGTRTIGALVFWTLANVNVGREDFRRAMAEEGLGAAVPRDPRPTTCLTTAVRKAMVGKSDAFVRRLDGGAWGIVLERQDVEDKRLQHAHVASVRVETSELKPTPELKWDVKARPGQLERLRSIGGEVQARFVEAMTRLDTSDLSAVMTTSMHGTTRDQLVGAVSLRERTGGLYFVHASKLDVLRRLKAVVERFCPECSIVVMTITGEADNLEQAAQAARQSFVAQLKELQAEVATFRSELGGKQPTDRNLTVRANRFKQLAARVELFGDILGDVAGELKTQIDQARVNLEAELEL